MNHFQMRNFPLEMREFHVERFHHALRGQKRCRIKTRISHDNFADANLRGELEIPFSERIDDHRKFHAAGLSFRGKSAAGSPISWPGCNLPQVACENFSGES